jgi:hydroxyacylglutathione hydrolase
MIKVKRFINQLMSSNCFVVYDDNTKRAVVVDPGSEKSEKEITFIENNKLEVDYIILTHEHTDHNWGVNALLDKYPSAKLVCSELCDKLVKKTNRIFFSFYYDNPDYVYTIASADFLIKSKEDVLSWDGLEIHFLMTPGHSRASMCIDIAGMLFTGDTIMPYPCYLNKKDGNMEDWEKSIAMVESKYIDETVIYPGHGDVLTLGEWKKNFSNDDR